MARPSAPALAALTALGVALPGLAFAHVGPGTEIGHAHGLVAGLLHPFTGLDHLLAMVLLGALAWQLGGRARWALPAAFLAAMALGGALGMAGLALPATEMGIALSVVALGAALALRPRTPLLPAVALAGGFAVFHGLAHGAELPAAASGLTYALGFLLATATLHGLGLLAGSLAAPRGGLALRLAGTAGAVAGLVLLAGLG